MTFDFKPWLNVAGVDASAPEPPITSYSKNERNNRAWATFGHEVAKRFGSPDYQKLVTYALLAGANGTLVAKMVKDYVMHGKLPWQS